MALASKNAVAKFICSLGPREQPGFKPIADRTYSWQIASLPKIIICNRSMVYCGVSYVVYHNKITYNIKVYYKI